MPAFWLLLYNLVAIPLFIFTVGIGTLVNKKVRRAVLGRRALFVQLQKKMALLDRTAPRLWIHACSMGEFEQARPLIAAARERIPNVAVLLSVTSPSVRDHITEGAECDVVTYLPLDTLPGARRFIRIARPQIGVVVRHDIWPNHIAALRRSRAPAVLIDASLSAKICPGRWSGRVVGRLLYSSFDYILATSAAEAERLRAVAGAGPTIIPVGDTRYDQVKRRSMENDKVRDLQHYFGACAQPVFLAGSTWPADERHLLPALRSLCGELGLRVIFVPHEPGQEHLAELERQLAAQGLASLRLSVWRQGAKADGAVLVVDEVGILANLYSVADVAYVGGGFTTGVHSVLEPAVYGIPVLFGPHHSNSNEALDLVRRGGGFVVNSTEEVEKYLSRLLHNGKARETAGSQARAMVEERMGASVRIVEFLEKILGGQEAGRRLAG
ncbi:MAG: glycosyltransferase N-terminal domain-containing protein [bacterium]|jgi:3-deoxy-D-manno-octulosonic-acid transferase|nr:hypothetical protein [candidate division KSB1 bacterium]MDH7559826.1 glycosyltransferase N-terminal domain-containing protein [bacterium]